MGLLKVVIGKMEFWLRQMKINIKYKIYLIQSQKVFH